MHSSVPPNTALTPPQVLPKADTIVNIQQDPLVQTQTHTHLLILALSFGQNPDLEVDYWWRTRILSKTGCKNRENLK